MNVGLLAGFLFKAILWLVLCLLVWYPLGSVLVMPVGWLAGLLAHWPLSGRVDGVDWTGSTVSLLTTLQVGSPDAATQGVALVSPEANFMTYGYGLPLVMALFLASQPRQMAARMAVAAVALIPFQAMSLLFDWLKQIAIQSGPEVAAQLGFGDVGRNLIGLGYQFGTLVLPTLVPVLLWLALDRKLVTTLLVEAYLDKATPDGSGRDSSPQ